MKKTRRPRTSRRFRMVCFLGVCALCVAGGRAGVVLGWLLLVCHLASVSSKVGWRHEICGGTSRFGSQHIGRDVWRHMRFCAFRQVIEMRGATRKGRQQRCQALLTLHRLDRASSQPLPRVSNGQAWQTGGAPRKYHASAAGLGVGPSSRAAGWWHRPQRSADADTCGARRPSVRARAGQDGAGWARAQGQEA